MKPFAHSEQLVPLKYPSVGDAVQPHPAVEHEHRGKTHFIVQSVPMYGGWQTEQDEPDQCPVGSSLHLHPERKHVPCPEHWTLSSHSALHISPMKPSAHSVHVAPRKNGEHWSHERPIHVPFVALEKHSQVPAALHIPLMHVVGLHMYTLHPFPSNPLAHRSHFNPPKNPKTLEL